MKVASEEDKESLNGITHNFMSDEEDGEERGVWVVRSPSWRSQNLNTILERLQEKVASQDVSSRHPKYRRVRGRPSSRSAPSNAPSWALNEQLGVDETEGGTSDVSDHDQPDAIACSTPCSTPLNNAASPVEREEDDENVQIPRPRKKAKKKKRRL